MECVPALILHHAELERGRRGMIQLESEAGATTGPDLIGGVGDAWKARPAKG